MPTTMPAIVPPERLGSDEFENEASEGSEVGFARALAVTVLTGESGVGVDEGEDEDVLALPGVSEMAATSEAI